MPRRIEIELTSSRDDGTWTWRAAGAREPRGTVPAPLLPDGAKVGDVVRADAEFFVDGIEITTVLPPKGGRREPERLELIGSPGRDEPAVTTSLAPKGRGDRGSRGDRPPRDRDRPSRERDRGDDRPARGDGRGPRRDGGPAEARRGGGRPGRNEGRDRPPRRARPEPPPMPAVERPKAKRLRPSRVHRKAMLEALPEEQRPIAEQLFLGGMPAVRQAIEKQNAERTEAGESPIQGQPLLELAERLVNRVRAAEWRDRAEAALRDVDELDLRDLRSVVSAADAGARDQESRELASTLREALVKRVEQEHAAWLAELAATLDVGRVVRALRVSSRPPKAGSPLPPELATRLIDATAASLTADASPDRWVAVIEALAFSPVRDRVIPTSLPTEVHDDLRAVIARLGTRLPKIAHIFSIEPDRSAGRSSRQERRKSRGGRSDAKKQGGRRPKQDTAAPPNGDATDRTPPVDEPPVEEPPVDGPPVADQPPDASAGQPAAEPELPGTGDPDPVTGTPLPHPSDEVVVDPSAEDALADPGPAVDAADAGDPDAGDPDDADPQR
jgi:hypothetical protein